MLSHAILPVPQSPVRQEKRPEASVVQKERPQKRPDQAGGTGREEEEPGCSGKPVWDRGALLAPERAPTQTA